MLPVSKRIFDMTVGAVGLALAAPVLALVAAAVWWDMGNPVIFRQVRPGFKGRPFTMFKFRTMRETFQADGSPQADHLRLTKLGRFLRRTSLDELPELVNVLRGEMGLVGPRPLLMEYLPRYTVRQARRHDVRPGITGMAQVYGRNLLSWEEKFELDVRYVENWSFWLDLKILVRTVWKVASMDGISAINHATMRRFGEDPPQHHRPG